MPNLIDPPMDLRIDIWIPNVKYRRERPQLSSLQGLSGWEYRLSCGGEQRLDPNGTRNALVLRRKSDLIFQVVLFNKLYLLANFLYDGTFSFIINGLVFIEKIIAVGIDGDYQWVLHAVFGAGLRLTNVIPIKGQTES